jgi:hypothetical protein
MTYHRPLSGKHSRLGVLALTLCSGLPQLHGQDAGTNANYIGLIQRRPGIQLESISENTSYSLLPTPSASLVPSAALPAAWDVRTGISGSVAFSKPSEHGGFSLDYSGGYGRRVKYSDVWDSYNSAHMGYWYAKEIRPRWNYAFRLDSHLMDFESYFLSPSGTSLSPTAVNAAASAVAAQTGSQPAAATQDLVSSGLIQNSPAQSALYGGRVLTTTVSNTLSFTASPRLSYSFGLSAVRNQSLSSSSASAPGQFLNSAPGLLDQGTFGTASGGFAYLLTARTSMGASVAVSRSFSRLGDSLYIDPQFHIDHTFTPWWHAGAYLGVGFTSIFRQTAPGGSPNRRPTGGVSTSFLGASQVFTLTAAATAQDIYAIGSGRTFTGIASWLLHLPNSRWSFNANASAYSTGTAGSGSLSTWFASAGANRVLASHLFMTLSGSYSNFQGQLLNNLAGASGSPVSSAFNNQVYRGVQVSLTWAPANLHW